MKNKWMNPLLKCLPAAALLLLASQPAMADNRLVVTHDGGTPVVYTLSGDFGVVVKASELVFIVYENKSDGGVEHVEVHYPLTAVTQFKLINENPPTGIAEAPTADAALTFRFADGLLKAEGANPGTLVQLYALDGRLLAAAEADDLGCVSLPLPEGGAAAGAPIYVVRAGDVSFKIAVKK